MGEVGKVIPILKYHAIKTELSTVLFPMAMYLTFPLTVAAADVGS